MPRLSLRSCVVLVITTKNVLQVRGQPSFCSDQDPTLLGTCGTFCPNGDRVPAEARENRFDTNINNDPLLNVTCGFYEENVYPCFQSQFEECAALHLEAIRFCGCDRREIPYETIENDCYLCPNNEPYTADPNFLVEPVNEITCEIAEWLAYSKSGSSDSVKAECLAVQGTLGAACGCPNPPQPPCNGCGEEQEPNFEAVVASEVDPLLLAGLPCTALFFLPSLKEEFCTTDGIQETLAGNCCRETTTCKDDPDYLFRKRKKHSCAKFHRTFAKNHETASKLCHKIDKKNEGEAFFLKDKCCATCQPFV